MGRAKQQKRHSDDATTRIACYTLAVHCETEPNERPPLTMLLRRPVSLLSLPPRSAVMFMAGAIAGAVGKTAVAPLDRVKILLQVRGGLQTGAVREAAIQGGVFRSLWAICKEEGVLSFWKGNLPQLIRVVPYTAVQLGSYEVFKRLLRNEDGTVSVKGRLLAGAAAGICSTLATYPLDTLRFRLAVDPDVKTIRAASQALWKESGIAAFYRGLKPALIGIAPYMALELTSFDIMPSSVPSFFRGFMAALIATSFCYPLDTIRRHGQLATNHGRSSRYIAKRIFEAEGIGGLYRGFLPNAAKNLPNKGIRLSTFEAVKSLLSFSQTVYAEQTALYLEQQEQSF